MNFLDIQNSVIGARFNETQRDNVKNWINWRYQWVNGMNAWPWMAPVSGTYDLTTGSATLTDNVIRILNVYDTTNDAELTYLDPIAFRKTYAESETGTTPDSYTITNNDGTSSNTYDQTIELGPPGSTANVEIVFEKRPPMLEANDDEPVWPSAYHFLLVLGATSTGLKVENDPTWDSLETEFLAGIDAMRSEILPPHLPEPRQYGREMFDVWV